MSQDVPPPDVILALFNGAFLDQIDLATKHRPQLVFHLHQIKKTVCAFWFKFDQDVNITVWSKILAQN